MIEITAVKRQVGTLADFNTRTFELTHWAKGIGLRALLIGSNANNQQPTTNNQ